MLSGKKGYLIIGPLPYGAASAGFSLHMPFLLQSSTVWLLQGVIDMRRAKKVAFDIICRRQCIWMDRNTSLVGPLPHAYTESYAKYRKTQGQAMFRNIDLKAPYFFFEKEKPKFIFFSSVSHLIQIQEHKLGHKTIKTHQHWRMREPETFIRKHVHWWPRNHSPALSTGACLH